MRTTDDLRTALLSLEPRDSADQLSELDTRIRRRISRRRTARRGGVLGTLGAVTAAAAACAVLLAQAGPSRPNAGSGTNPQAALSAPVVRSAILTALDKASGDILVVRMSGPAVSYDQWYWPMLPATGQREHIVSEEFFRTGHAARPYEINYAAYQAGPRFTQTPGCDLMSVFYSSRTWTSGHFPGTCGASGLTGSFAAQFRQGVASGRWKVIGKTTFRGRPAIEVRIPENHGVRALLWVDPKTYLPLFVTAHLAGDRPPTTETFQVLPPTAANIAKLPFSVPPGFRRK